MLWTRPRTWQLVGLVLLLAAAIVFIVLAITARNSPPAEDFTPPAAEEAVDEPVTASFIGDSYTQGIGATVPANRWVSIVAKANGYAVVNLGRGGTGYLTTSDVNGCGLDFCPNFLSMVDSVDPATEVLVVAGGQNDFVQFSADPAPVTAAIDETYAAARLALPDADIVAVGPSTLGGASADARAFDQAVRRAAEAVGARYVSMLEPPVLGPDLLSADGVHPNDAGHAAIAARYLAGIPPAA